MFLGKKESQPHRPSVEQFHESALRYLRDDYIRLNPFTGLYKDYGIHRMSDMRIIAEEYEAEGKTAEPFDVETFALRQLAAYAKLRHELTDRETTSLTR